jgi:rubrerythrin
MRNFMQTFNAIKIFFEQSNTIQSKVFNLLKDCEWHCRNCEGAMVASGQYAGGGGIQGLERGTKSRAGLVILTEKKQCPICNTMTNHDKFTGEVKQSNAPSNIPKPLQRRILEYFDYTARVHHSTF